MVRILATVAVAAGSCFAPHGVELSSLISGEDCADLLVLGLLDCFICARCDSMVASERPSGSVAGLFFASLNCIGSAG